MTNRRQLFLTAAAASLVPTASAADTTPLDSEKFRVAVVTGDLATVTSMLDRDPALTYARDASGLSVYMLACLKGQPKVAEELTRRGLVLDIFEAAVSGNAKLAADLAKDDPGIAHRRLPDGRTPLHLAAEAGKPDMVIFCAMRGADLSAGPESPLLAAVDLPDHAAAAEISNFLLINASDPDARRRDGKSALDLATVRGYDDIVQNIIHRGAKGGVYYGRRYTQDLHGNPVAREDTYGLPIQLVNQFSSVAHFDFEKVKQLQKLCPMLVMTRATWDELGIEAAAHMGLVPMAQYLADLGAPVSTCTATLLGARDLVKRLITEDPACLRERGAHDLALLAYTAFGNQQLEIAGLLLRAGADIHARSFGQTALHFAAGKGYVELAKLFLDHGADLNATARIRGTSLTPLELALQAKQAKMAEFLKQCGAGPYCQPPPSAR